MAQMEKKTPWIQGVGITRLCQVHRATPKTSEPCRGQKKAVDNAFHYFFSWTLALFLNDQPAGDHRKKRTLSSYRISFEFV